MSNIIPADFRPTLNYPQTWPKSSIATYERLREKWGDVETQAEIDRVEVKLIAFRKMRAA